jgi:hypothetical protein
MLASGFRYSMVEGGFKRFRVETRQGKDAKAVPEKKQ